MILWVVLAALGLGSLYALIGISEWRTRRYKEYVSAENSRRAQEEDICRRDAEQSLPFGVVASRLVRLRNDTVPPTSGSLATLFPRSPERRSAARDSLLALRDSLGSDTLRAYAAIDSLQPLWEGCWTDRLVLDDAPSARPFEVLFLVVALGLLAIALTTTWVWLGARK